MGKFNDRIIVFFLSVFAMFRLWTGRYLIVVVYLTAIITFFNYVLLYNIKTRTRYIPETGKQKAAFILQTVSLSLVFWKPGLFVFLPVLVYDMVVLRNVVGLGMGVLVFALAVRSGIEAGVLLYILFLSLVAVYLSIMTGRYQEINSRYKKLRDENAVKEKQLKEKNTSLLEAKDREIYTTQLRERNRIAREIHDNVGHMLTRAILQIGALCMVYREEEPLDSQLKEVRKTLDVAMDNIRTSVHDLHDESIDVKAAIEQIMEPLEKHFSVRLDIDISENMSREIKYVLIGVVKEAVSNIIKYSANQYVEITLREHPSIFQLIIHDFAKDAKEHKVTAPARQEGRGMGLENIETRVKNAGGSVRISVDSGYRIFAVIPKS